MKKLSKNQIDQEVFNLYDQYAHNKIQRRDFIEKLSMYAVGGLTVPALLEYLLPDYQNTAITSGNDPNLYSEYIEYDSPRGGGNIKGLFSMPAEIHEDDQATVGGIVIVHENRGLNPYIEDTARQAALAGFVTLAPDALSPLGGYPGNDDEGRTMQRQRDRDEMLEDFIAAYEYLKAHDKVNGKIGVVGFCFGGWISNMMAVRLPDLAAAVPFYGSQPAAEDVPRINAPLMIHYAELDERVNAGWPKYEESLKEHNKEYQVYFYPGANHGFHNTSTPRYDEEAAKLAWGRTIDFFKENLK